MTWDESDVNELVSKKRMDKDKYKWFYTNVLSHVVGRVYWKKYEAERGGMEMATVSDEAMALLLLENGFESWMHKNLMGGSEQVSRESVPPKYTVREKDGSTKEFKGWSDDGLERFNELCQEVTEDRTKNGKKFDDTYKVTRRRGVTRKRKRASVSTIQVFDEFSGEERTGSDEDDDSESERALHGRQHESV